jgi:hypothetical protein
MDYIVSLRIGRSFDSPTRTSARQGVVKVDFDWLDRPSDNTARGVALDLDCLVDFEAN